MNGVLCGAMGEWVFACGKYRDPTPLLDHYPRIKKLCYTIANIERFVFG